MKISLYPRALVIFSALMFLVTAEAASAQPEQPEPDTPTVGETMKYIQDHITQKIDLEGTTLWVGRGGQGYVYQIDLLKVYAHNLYQDIWIRCLGELPCINYGQGTHTFAGKLTSFTVNDGSMQPRVVIALNHLIRLLRKEAPTDNDPFRPPG